MSDTDHPIPPGLLKLARKAAASCPTLALLVERSGDPERTDHRGR